jgi:hypothetical protein
METEGRLSLEQIRVFLEGSDGVAFEAKNRAELYQWVHLLLREPSYDRLGRASKDLVRQYMAKMTGLGRAQVTRLIGRYLAGGEVKAVAYRRLSCAVTRRRDPDRRTLPSRMVVTPSVSQRDFRRLPKPWWPFYKFSRNVKSGISRLRTVHDATASNAVFKHMASRASTLRPKVHTKRDC